MLSLLVSHMRYRNSHRYLIHLLTSHMIQYSSGYDLRFPRKRSWFESQPGNNIYFLLLLFSVCICCFYFYIFFFFFICKRIDYPPTSAYEPRHEKTNVLHMRKQRADQLRGNHEADQRLCFRYLDSMIPLLSKPQIPSLWPSSVAVQPGLCRTRSETRMLVFSRRGSFKYKIT